MRDSGWAENLLSQNVNVLFVWMWEEKLFVGGLKVVKILSAYD